MKHRPYSEWALADEPLSHEQQRELAEHLRECEACRELQAAWVVVHSKLQAAQPIAAPDGFKLRVMERLAGRKQRDQTRQAWLIFIISFLGSLATMGTLAYLQASRLAEGMGNLIRSLIDLSEELNTVFSLLVHFLQLLPGPTSGLVGVSLLVASAGGMVALFAGLGMLWTAAVYRFAYPSSRFGGLK